jgi:hypothetical protein
MDNVIVWLALGGAVVVSVLSLVFIQKKSKMVKKLSDELEAIKQTSAENAKELEDLQNEFESKMDEVVESSIQKISHAEQAKEEAIQAAQDNYEAVADAHAQLKEKDELIKKLQKA